MAPTQRDRRAETEIRKAVEELFGGAVERIVIGPTEGPDDEPALFVTVYMKAGQEWVSGSKSLDTIEAASAALRDIEDLRFPYVTFLAPEDEVAESAPPAA